MHLLKADKPTVIKRYPGREPGFESFNLSPKDVPLLVRRMEIDPENTSFYKIELREPIKGLFNWFAFAEHVIKRDAPDNWILATDPTAVKRRPVGSDQLKDEEKFNMPAKAQPLLANWVRQEGNHFEFELIEDYKAIESYKGVSNWFIFVNHAEVEGKPLLVDA